MAADVPCCGTEFFLFLVIIIGLVAFAGLMAGLTLGLMSLGLVDLEVLIKAGRPQDRKHAAKIFPVVKNQHLLLCTLLIGNALAMESLPIFLDKLVPPWAAVLISVTLILMFGEILPQAVCTRYGMTVGAKMAPFVRVLLMLFFPIAYPISKVLDWMLGKGHAALLRRAELKTFVDFHGNEAGKGGDLTHDETTIIAGALEMTEKTAKDAMTPISKAFTLDLDGILTLDLLNTIMTMGHSRVPVYAGNPKNIIGLILIKNLLTVDPVYTLPLRKMLIRKIPRVSENMPLYDILNEFQKGHSHIAVVIRDLNKPTGANSKLTGNEHPESTRSGFNRTPHSWTKPDDALTDPASSNGDQQTKKSQATVPTFKKRHKGCSFCILDTENSPLPEFPPNEEVIGVITMEDVIEELLQEEILDETDEYVNIHNRIKVNMHPSLEKLPDINSERSTSTATVSSPGSGSSIVHEASNISATLPSSSILRESDTPGDQMASCGLISETEQWKDLKAHVGEIDKTHLRELMNDVDRCKAMIVEFDGLVLDYSRQRATVGTIDKLIKLAEAASLKQKINRMYNGEHINSTEDRSVLHIALRSPRDSTINSDGKNVVPEVWKVLDKIQEFTEKIRSGSWVGATGEKLTSVVAIGIGGSFLGPLFVHTALQTDPEAAECAKDRQLRFLANVDPIDVARNLKGLDPATTLVVVVSKTFTTAETMLNARTLKAWIVAALGPGAVAKHMVAVSTNLTLVEKFGIDPNNAFGFWDWVGGRYSVCSAVGVLPLSLQYGFPVVEKFLNGAASIDNHFYSTPLEKNIPVLLGLLSVWNVTFLGYPARAILPYSQALEKFAPHIQQVSMESNGKGVSIDGIPLPFESGEIDFGEPGTNGQHSFYQLIHQGRIIPCDFIGVVKSQQPVYLKDEIVSNHDELMSNFFAQPDALAYGKTAEQLHKENVAPHLIPHKTFTGNRPSLSLLLPSLNAYNVGQLLAIYEHRVAVQGFIWGINSFDQWGVELGKSLASQVRNQLHKSRTAEESIHGFNHSTTFLLSKYLEASSDVPANSTTHLPRV